MSLIDWVVLLFTLSFVVLFGVWKGKGDKNIEGYLLGGKSLVWYQVCLSVMATQASAITFLSAPGQAYTDGMRFVQFYFGLPLAMIVLSVTFVPIFKNLNVYTAYEYLEGRFDLKTRTLTTFLFLIPRALSTGVTIAAPSIILSTLLGWDLAWTNIVTGLIVTFYCVAGGSRGVSYTQMQQMFVVLLGMVLVGVVTVHLLPTDVGFVDSLKVAGKLGRMNIIDWKWDLNNRYNVWSGLIGGFFLQLSYFGTDQSQVGRYITATTVSESRIGLLMNGLLKIPMQFFILLVGILVFVFYQYTAPPLIFNQTQVAKIESSTYAKEFADLKGQQSLIFSEKKTAIIIAQAAEKAGNMALANTSFAKANGLEKEINLIRTKAQDLLKKNDSNADANDINYIFLSFVTAFMPVGLVGLLIAVILLASMGSMASAFNSLTSTSIVDIYKRLIKKNGTEKHYLTASKFSTLCWGLFCIVVAQYATKVGSLIEVVNILGSCFYGTILGVFLVAFYIKAVNGTAVFYAAILAECFVIYFYWKDLTAFLWLNLIGCVLVVLFAIIFEAMIKKALPNK